MTTATVGIVPDLGIAERLHLARWRMGIGSKEFAQRSGISRATVGNYESRDWSRTRNPIYLRRWAEITGVSLHWLETGEPGPEDPGPGSPGALPQMDSNHQPFDYWSRNCVVSLTRDRAA